MGWGRIFGTRWQAYIKVRVALASKSITFELSTAQSNPTVSTGACLLHRGRLVHLPSVSIRTTISNEGSKLNELTVSVLIAPHEACVSQTARLLPHRAVKGSINLFNRGTPYHYEVSDRKSSPGNGSRVTAT